MMKTGVKAELRDHALSGRTGQDGYLLHAKDTLAQLAADTVAYGRRLDLEHVTAHVSESAGTTMKVCNGTNSAAVRDGGTGLTVTVYDRGRRGSSSTSVLTSDAMRLAVERARDVANRLEPDHDARPAEPEWLSREQREVPMFAPSGHTPADLNDAAIEIERIARETDAARNGVVTIMHAQATSHDTQNAMAISPDFVMSFRESLQGRSCLTLAKSPDGMAQGFWSSQDRRVDYLFATTEIAQTAVMRAVRKLGGRSAPSGIAPVLFEAGVSSSLVAALASTLFGDAQEEKATFLPDALGRQVLGSDIDLVEDPFEPYGLRSGGIDGEGIAGSHRHIIRDGVVEGLFLNAKAARTLGMTPTGNADGCWNVTLRSRSTMADDDLAAMLRKLDRGLWVTELLGGQSDGVTGSYSMAVSGLWVEGGEPVYAVQDTTVAGDLVGMLSGISAIGADVRRRTAVRCGSILIDAMRITGR